MISIIYLIWQDLIVIQCCQASKHNLPEKLLINILAPFICTFLIFLFTNKLY